MNDRNKSIFFLIFGIKGYTLPSTGYPLKMIATVIKYILAFLGIILAYEILRSLVLGRLKDRLYRSVKDYLEQNRTRLDKYKFMHKLVVKQELLNDREIHQMIIEHAREKGMKIRDVQNQVEEYIEEIVPFFNLLSYYKIGYWIANFLLNLIYEVVIDRENAARLKKIPPDSVVIFVMNHRSNIDYILVAYMLAQQISLSYAVGEWARVWPLEYIFKSFGAYFIRRKYREKLYHLVLEKYVQLISLQGVTQGIFLEGGLSRDGDLRKAKIGILDYIVKIKKNPEFKGEIVFVPAAINYDWVLEDKTLIQEMGRGKERSGFRDHASSLLRMLFKGPLLFLRNLLRYATGRLKQHGYASVSFGDPVFLSGFLKRQARDIFELDRYSRLERVQAFADDLIERIGKAIPVTPVAITARAILTLGHESIARTELYTCVTRLRRLYKAHNARIVLGKAFEASRAIQEGIDRERDSRQRELVAFEDELVDFEEAMQTVDVSLDILKRRRIVSIKNGRILLSPRMRPLLEYYANSLNRLAT